MTRRLLSLALLTAAPAHAEPLRVVIAKPSGPEVGRPPVRVDPEITRRVFGAKVKLPEDPLAKPKATSDLPWVDVPRVPTEQDELERPEKPRAMIVPMWSPKGGGIKVKIPF